MTCHGLVLAINQSPLKVVFFMTTSTIWFGCLRRLDKKADMIRELQRAKSRFLQARKQRMTANATTSTTEAELLTMSKTCLRRRVIAIQPGMNLLEDCLAPFHDNI